MIYKNTKNIEIYIDNPFKTYKRVSKYFKRPKIKFIFEWLGYRKYLNKHILININDVKWKLKYDYISVEYTPSIYLRLFKCIYISLSFRYKCDDLIYWETLLTYLYLDKTLQEAIDLNTWHTKDNNLDDIKLDAKSMLTDYALVHLNEKYTCR